MRGSSWPPAQPGCATPTRFAGLSRGVAHAQQGGPIGRRSGVPFRCRLTAVEAALTLPWSTSPVEGQINRVKTLKRTMYGRAKLDLLRARVLAA